uniref:Uncharacterized protein n=1 Tax=Timema shepardi TaxID=629360 RepID=A0A7R9G4W1_TIMSH|nr:unnamed protein product [Timema shepardi]
MEPNEQIPLSISYSIRISLLSGVPQDLSNLVEVGLNLSVNQARCRRETGDWPGPKPTSLEQGLASWLGVRGFIDWPISLEQGLASWLGVRGFIDWSTSLEQDLASWLGVRGFIDWSTSLGQGLASWLGVRGLVMMSQVITSSRSLEVCCTKVLFQSNSVTEYDTPVIVLPPVSEVCCTKVLFQSNSVTGYDTPVIVLPPVSEVCCTKVLFQSNSVTEYDTLVIVLPPVSEVCCTRTQPTVLYSQLETKDSSRCTKVLCRCGFDLRRGR